MKPSTSLADIKEYSLSYHEDYRGEIFTTYKDSLEGSKFDHDKICIRPQNCLVGIHGDYNTWKLITCLYGNVYCVLVDKRPESDDLNKHKTFILNNKNKKQLLLPPGIGNSFLVLSEFCVYNYKTNEPAGVCYSKLVAILVSEVQQMKKEMKNMIKYSDIQDHNRPPNECLRASYL